MFVWQQKFRVDKWGIMWYKQVMNCVLASVCRLITDLTLDWFFSVRKQDNKPVLFAARYTRYFLIHIFLLQLLHIRLFFFFFFYCVDHVANLQWKVCFVYAWIEDRREKKKKLFCDLRENRSIACAPPFRRRCRRCCWTFAISQLTFFAVYFLTV